jgi:hypothetical protein
MRHLLSRLRDGLLDFLTGAGVQRESVRAEKRRAEAQLRFQLEGLKELSPVDAREVAETLAVWRSAPPEPRYDYVEPIGPKRLEELTVDERWQVFEADPLAAVLPGAPAKDNPAFAEVHASLPLSKAVAEDLELTRGWEIGQLPKLAQMAGKAER